MTRSTKPEAPEDETLALETEARKAAAKLLGAFGGRKGGKAKGASKRRGNSAYYKGLGKK